MKKRLETIESRNKRLLNAYRDSDVEARQQILDEIVIANIPLVKYVANRFKGKGVSFDDLCQCGYVGLIKAVPLFDNDRGIKFSAYATASIKGEILRYFRDRFSLMKTPRKVGEISIKIERAIEALRHKMGREPTADEIAQELGVDVKEVNRALFFPRDIISLDSLLGEEDSNSSSFADMVLRCDAGLEVLEQRDFLSSVMAVLSEEETWVVLLTYWEDLDQKTIGDILGISKSKVSCVVNRALRKMRKCGRILIPSSE